jgi:hypothetical protein
LDRCNPHPPRLQAGASSPSALWLRGPWTMGHGHGLLKCQFLGISPADRDLWSSFGGCKNAF